jgi:hypothetical protein
VLRRAEATSCRFDLSSNQLNCLHFAARSTSCVALIRQCRHTHFDGVSDRSRSMKEAAVGQTSPFESHRFLFICTQVQGDIGEAEIEKRTLTDKSVRTCSLSQYLLALDRLELARNCIPIFFSDHPRLVVSLSIRYKVQMENKSKTIYKQHTYGSTFDSQDLIRKFFCLIQSILIGSATENAEPM